MCWASIFAPFLNRATSARAATQAVRARRVRRRPFGCVAGRARAAGKLSRCSPLTSCAARARRSRFCHRNMPRRPTHMASKLLPGQARRCAARRRCVTCSQVGTGLHLLPLLGPALGALFSVLRASRCALQTHCAPIRRQMMPSDASDSDSDSGGSAGRGRRAGRAKTRPGRARGRFNAADDERLRGCVARRGEQRR